jgi:hypothetical protein
MKLLHCLCTVIWLLIALSNTRAVAQPFSFPICQGDASSWHIQMREPRHTDYTPPLIQTISIERDTVAYGETYFLMDFPEQLRLPAMWVRSDSSGMHCLTAAGDSLLLPSIDKIGTPVMGGKISNALTVNTVFGMARAYRITRVDGDSTLVWTIADGIGIWDFKSWRGGGGERTYCRFISGRRCGRGPVGDPHSIDVPLRAGDILVRSRKDGSSTIETARGSSAGPYWVGLPASSALQFGSCSYSVTINADGNVLYETNMTAAPACEYYPAYIPAVDTITLDSRRWSVERRFDTTVFSQPVRAFAIRGQSSLGEFVRIVAEKFGVIREIQLSPSHLSFSTTLTSAVINGTAYNRNTERHRFFPLCKNNVYEYRMSRYAYDTIARVRLTQDTLVDGKSYFRFRLPGIPYYPGDAIEKSLIDGWFREAEDGIYSIDSTLAYPFAADLGDITHSGIVTGIREQAFGNETRFVLITADIRRHYSRHDTLLENVGPISAFDFLLFEGGYDWQLSGATVCGDPWGIPLAVSETPLPPAKPAMQLYPNPAPAGTGFINIRITGIAGNTVRLSLHDLLGRELRNHHMESVQSGAEYTIALGDLPAGIYVIRMQSGKRTMSKILHRQ